MDSEASMHNLLERIIADGNEEARHLPLSLLRSITNDFSDDQKIGSGAYAVVYKGLLSNGQAIAVKKLISVLDRDDDKFKRLVDSLMKIKHKNTVRFLGYCTDTEQEAVYVDGAFAIRDASLRILCFEYVPNGSLDAYITGASSGVQWGACYKIIKGICEGLHYLHTNHIVHSNLKPANILLDDRMMPKIGDFGLSRYFDHNENDLTPIQVTETLGYVAPEFFAGKMTLKNDIYSLGIIITEILTGQKGYSTVENIVESWSDRSGMSRVQSQQVRVCAEIGLKCWEYDRSKRPDTGRIIMILNETESIEAGMSTLSLPELVDDAKSSIVQRGKNAPNNLDTMPEETSSEVLPKFEGQKRPTTVREDSRTSVAMEDNILERIVDGSEEPKYLHLSLLQDITGYFSEQRRIGVGGCGEVYKGILQNGVIVAVKRLLRSSTIKDKMFDREVQSLIGVTHQNIVRFLGYCSLTEEHLVQSGTRTIKAEIRERLLCLEYIRNGSLDSYLTDELRGLEWPTRYEIIMGICNGLFYLHNKGIIHMDLKPANILLDDLMVPKITDFGLARFESDYSQTATASRFVSRGYCAPEYLLEGKSSSKSDIYSLGAIIIEVVTGSNKPHKLHIPKVLRKWRHRWIKSSKHTPLGYQQVTKCLKLAQRCMQFDPTDRPDMSKIIDELNEIDSKDDEFQEIPYFEDMIGIEPLEIHFPFEEHDQQIAHSIELTNDADDYFAFIANTSLGYLGTEPEKGIVQPRSKCSVTVTMQAPVRSLLNNYCKEEITMLSTRTDGGFAAKDITRNMFIDEGKLVDEVNVLVVIGKPPLAEES